MGEWSDKLKGKVKETTGVATGDRELEAEGKKDTAKGKIKEKVEDVKRVIKEGSDPDAPRRSKP